MAEKTVNIDTIIGRNIRTQRILKGWTQTEIAKSLNVSFQQVQKYEHGVNSVNPSNLKMLSGLFNCPVDLFFHDTKSGFESGDNSNSSQLETVKARLIIRHFLRIESPSLQELVYAIIRIVAAAKQ